MAEYDYDKEFEELVFRAFALIELVEVAGISDKSFSLIRKRLLDLGNDIKRLGEKLRQEGD